MATRCDEDSGVTVVLDILAILGGVAVVLLTLSDLFQSVVVPRATAKRYRVSYYFWRSFWRLWPSLAWRFFPNDSDRREEFFAVFAPLGLVSLMGMWVASLIVGFGLILWGLRSGVAPANGPFGMALYFAGTSVLTIGFGDVVGRSGAARFVSVLAGLSGLSLLSINTAYLFAIFASFQTRETFVVTVGARAGAPPSGVNLLAIAGYSMTRDDLGSLMVEAQRWAAQVMESHLAYPVLAYFRSSHDDQSWLGTLGTLLDAATLLMTTVEGGREGQARIFYNVGRHATRDLSHYFGTATAQESVGIERAEFEHACDRLAAAGYTLRPRDEAWLRFGELRASYATQLNSLARFFEIPPLSWIGDRSNIALSPH